VTFKNAFITGASSGIGRAIALELGRGGTRVVLAARRREMLESLAADVARAGSRAEICELDVSDTAAVDEAVSRWDKETDGFDLILANAGVGQPVKTTELTFEDVENVIDVNIKGAVATLIAGMRVMLPRGRGTLAGVSSLAGVRAMPQSGMYPATKAALQSFLESLDMDLRDTGLRVVDIQPGWVRTPMTDVVEHKMPFMVEVEDSAKVCLRGLERGAPVVAFPWQLAWPLKTLGRALPRRIWGRLARMVKG
jgi:NADP-dependent 3-hydroxy acid dehydrogenase YdfG